jgi:hypothetical protein
MIILMRRAWIVSMMRPMDMAEANAEDAEIGITSPMTTAIARSVTDGVIHNRRLRSYRYCRSINLRMEKTMCR